MMDRSRSSRCAIWLQAPKRPFASSATRAPITTVRPDRKSTRLNSSHSLHDALPIYEVLNDGSLTIFALRDLVAGAKATLRVIGHARTYYDGPAFTGLPLAQLGNFGAPVRSESLVFQDDFLT